MKKKTKEIIELRKLGCTYKEIKKKTGQAKSTISYICNKYVATNQKIRQQHLDNLKPSKERLRRAKEAQSRYYKNLRSSKIVKWTSKLNQLEKSRVCYMAGLYDGEGNHKGTEFRISNSNKDIVLFIVEFLTDIEANLALTLSLHSTHVRQDCLDYWKQWGIVPKYISQYDNRKQSRDYSAKENYGTVYIRVYKPLGLRDALALHSFPK